MKSFDLLNAMGELDEETVLSARETPAKTAPARRRIPRAALIAAVLAAILSLSAVAYYAISHRNTAALMEAGPQTSGRVQVVIDETGQSIIDDAAVDLSLTQTSNGTSVTAESLMGFTDPTQSLVYLTFTVTPPEGYEFPDDMSYWCFWNIRYAAVPDDIQLPRAEATVKNPDGTASVLWMISPTGATAGHRLHIELGGFGMASKEVCADLYSGARTIELPGSWVFDFEIPELPATQEVTFDAAACKAAGLPITALRLNSFGGIAELEPQELSQRKAFCEMYGERLKEDFPTVDFDRMDDAEFDALCKNGVTDGFLTEAEFAKLQDLLDGLPPFDFVHPTEVTLEYPDGADYTVSFGEYGDNLLFNWTEQGNLYCEIVFSNPQPISQATAIVIDGVRIPLG